MRDASRGKPADPPIKGLKKRALGVSCLGAILVAWELFGRSGLVPPLFLPPLTAVIGDGLELLRSGDLMEHLGSSLWRIIWGFLIGAGVGVILGLAMGISQLADASIHPIIAATYPIPKTALLPLLILWLGLGESSKIAVIALGVFFPVVVNTRAGVLDVDPLLIKAALGLGSTRARIARKVLLPASLPMIFAGLKLGAGVALLLLVTAEMIAADRGIGFLILLAANLMQTTRLLFGILILAALGLLSNWLLAVMERALLPWKSEFQPPRLEPR